MNKSNSLALFLFFCMSVFHIGCDEDVAQRNNDKDTDDENDSDTDTDTDTVSDSDTETISDSNEMKGGCSPFPQSFSEGAAFSFNDANFGQVVQYTEFAGLLEGHAWADAIFDLAMFRKFGAVFAAGEIDLSGDESNYATCAYCIRFSQGVTMNNGVPTNTDHMFMPVSGTLKIESISNTPGEVLKISIDAKMVEVTFDNNNNSVLVEGGCSFNLTEYTRTAIIKRG